MTDGLVVLSVGKHEPFISVILRNTYTKKAARDKAWSLSLLMLESWVRIPLKAWIFVLFFCVTLSHVPSKESNVEKQGAETSR
jgi:hypothetical protein